MYKIRNLIDSMRVIFGDEQCEMNEWNDVDMHCPVRRAGGQTNIIFVVLSQNEARLSRAGNYANHRHGRCEMGNEGSG